jgi:TP901 family phage tail tape measure protein
MAVYDVATRLVVQGVDTASVQRAVSTINTQLDRGTASARSFSDALALRGINLAGYTALGAVVVRVSASIAKATNDAIKFEYELAKIAQTVNKSNAEVLQHADSIRKISVAYGLSAPKIAETVRVLAQAGYSFKEAKASADSLSQTTLLSSFDNITDTTDGLIAINKQFTSTMGQSARVLSVLNTVSKKYAVESRDLVEATRKAGGVFASTGGNLEELVSIFTVVRDTTRESAETVATGLRTIFGRLQRPKTIEYLRELGIELTDLKGNFIGNYEAIRAIQEGIARNRIAPNSLQFAEIVEQLGGIRQQSRVIPLLTQAAKLQKIYSDAQSSTSDTAKDLAKAQETLSFKISQTQQNFSKFIGDIASTESFKVMISGILSVTNATIGFASALKELIPLIATIATVKLGTSLVRALGNPAAAFGNIGQKRKFASGGFVPGSGNGDTVPALLTPGEFVINKKSAEAFGYGELGRINKYAKGGVVSKIQKFAEGGKVDPDGLTQELRDLISEFKKKAPFLYKRGKSRLDLDGISENDLADLEAQAEQIRALLKKQSGKVHPDRFQGESGAADRFKSVRSKFDEFNAGTEQIKKKRATAAPNPASSPVNSAEQAKRAQEAYDQAQAQKTQQQREDDKKAAEATARATAEEARRTREEYKEKERKFNAQNGGLGGANGDSTSHPDDLGAASARQRAYNRSQESAGLGPAEGNTKSRADDFDTASARQKAYNTSQENAQNAGLGPARGNTSSSRPTNIATPGMAAKQAAYNTSQEAAGLGPAIGNTASKPIDIGAIGDKLTTDKAAAAKAAERSQQLAGTFATLSFVIAGVADQYTDQETVMGRMTSSVLNLISGLSLLQATLGQFGKSLDPKSVLDFGKNLLKFNTGGKGAIAGKIANASSGFLGKAGGALSGLGGKLSGVGAKFAGSTGALGIVGKASASAGASLTARGATVAGSSGSVGAAGASAAAFAAAGAAAYGFGKILDTIRGLEEQRAKAISDGNTVEAGKSAVSLQVQDDLTKLSAGAAIVATAFGGPLLGAAVGFTVKLAGLIPGVETGVGKLRDLGAALGVLESTALIAARSQSEAASVAADSNREKQAGIVGKKIDKVKDTKGANELVDSGEFKNAAQALATKKAAVDKQVGEARKALSQQANTSGLGESIDAVTSLGGLIGENLDETATRLDKEISDAQAGLKEQAEADFQQYSKVFDVKVQDFASSGEQDWGKFMSSLSKGEQDLITLSGSANILQESLRQAADIAKAEAAERLLNWQIMQKTSGALQQLAAVSKKGAEVNRLGDVSSSLASGNFRSSAISSAASSDSIKQQAVAAKALGINNYESIVGETSKNKDVLKSAEDKFAQGTLKGGSGELDRIKREIVQDANPDANVKDLKGDELNKAVEEVFKGGDAMKEALMKAAQDAESGFGKYLDSVSRLTSAQTEYEQSLLDFNQSSTNRDKEKQSFRVGGSTIAEIRDRQKPIASNAANRAALISSSAKLTQAGTSIVENQAAQSTSGKEDPSKTAATVSQGIELQRTFSGLQIAVDAQKAAVMQDTQARQQLIEALKEEIELEKGRAQTLDEFNTALSGAAGAEAKRDAQKKLASVKRVEQAYATGGVEAANKEIGRSVDKGVSREFLLSAMQTQTSEALGYQASEAGSTEARRRYGAGSNQSGFIADSSSVAFGTDAEGKRTKQTIRGAEVAAQAGAQMGEQKANEAALLQLQADNIEMLSNSAKIFGDSIVQMTAGLGSFNTELKTIVASLKDSSISMKLDTTKVVVDINSSQGLDALSAETKKVFRQMIAEQLLAQQQGQI